MTDEIQLLLEYIDLLEAEIKHSSPEQFLQITQKREGLLSLLQKQRALIATLRNAHQADQEEIVRLREQLAARQSAQKSR